MIFLYIFIEFRSMINRLLLPDPQKRIPITELVRHPWLTDRNRRPLRIHGMKELEQTWKSIVYILLCNIIFI